MSTLNIRLDAELEKNLERLAKRQHMTKSEVVRDVLRRYIALAELRAVREKMIPYAQAAGYYTDEDVFRDFS